MSSARIFNEQEFEDVFRNFQESKVNGQFGKVYQQVLVTVGTAHEKNKKQRLVQENELKSIREQSEDIDKQTQGLLQEKIRCQQELQNRQAQLAKLNQD